MIHQSPRTISKHFNYFFTDTIIVKTNFILPVKGMLEYTSQDLPNKFLYIMRQHNSIKESTSKEYLLEMDVHILMNAIQIHTTQDSPASFYILEDSWTIINTNNIKPLVRFHRVLLIVSICRRQFSKISTTQKPIFIIYTLNAIHPCILLRNRMIHLQFINKNYKLIIKLHKVLSML
jgi:hypothetical protein